MTTNIQALAEEGMITVLSQWRRWTRAQKVTQKNRFLQRQATHICRCSYTNAMTERWGLISYFSLQNKLVQQTYRESEHEFWQLFRKEERTAGKKKERKKTRTQEQTLQPDTASQAPFQLERHQRCCAGTSRRRIQLLLLPFQSPYTQREQKRSPWGC